MSDISETKYKVPNLEKALRIIELISERKHGVTVQEIVDLLGIAKTTVFRICQTLKGEGYFLHDEAKGEFRISRKFLSIGLSSLEEGSIISQAFPYMEKIRNEFHESVMLGVFVDNRVALMEQITGDHPFTFFVQPGQTFNLHSSAPGKLMLSYKNEEEALSILDSIQLTRYNDRTLYTKSQFIKEFDSIRSQGYSVDDAEESEGVHCVAAPIFNQFGKIVAVIWTTGPAFRFPKSDFPAVAAFVKKQCLDLSYRLGYNQ